MPNPYDAFIKGQLPTDIPGIGKLKNEAIALRIRMEEIAKISHQQ
jgi:hypothetical protein